MGPREEFAAVDSRPLQKLAPLMTLADLRKKQAESSERTPSPAKQHFLPSMAENKQSSVDNALLLPESTKPTWTPMLGAKMQLQADKPGMYERMEKAMGSCVVSRKNRAYRLNSLGVFEEDINEMRARTMFRVQLHQELSTKSMRLPNYQTKEVKLAGQDESIEARLERMYNRVLKSIDDPSRINKKQQSTGPLGLNTERGLGHRFSQALSASRGGQTGRGLDSALGGASMRSVNSIHTPNSATPSRHNRSAKGTRLSPWTGRVGQTSLRSPGGMSIGLNGTARPDWNSSMLPPEMALAHAKHIEALIEQHLEQYHIAVLHAQRELVLRQGLDAATIDMSPEQLDRFLAEKAKQEGDEIAIAEAEAEAKAELKEVSWQLINSTNAKDLADAAMRHVSEVAQELKELGTAATSTTVPGSKSSRRMLSKGVSNLHSNRSTSGEGDEDGTPRGDLTAEASLSGGVGVPSRAHSTRLVGGASFASPGPEDSEEEFEEELTAGPSSNVRGLKGTASTRRSKAAKSPGGIAILTPMRMNAFQGTMERALTGPTGLENLAKSKALPLLPAAPNASLHVQARLERLWQLLSMPLTQRLDMVIEYTKPQRVLQFDGALDLWERCAVAVLHREELMAQLNAIQRGVQDNTLPYVCVGPLEKLCVELVYATRHVAGLAEQLKASYSSTLTVAGNPYPQLEGEGPIEEQLMAFMEGLSKYEGDIMIME